MAYIGNQPAESFTSFATQEFSTSATTSYTLDHAVTNENEIALFVNNVRQQPGSGKAYTATGTALTLSAATASTDTMYCVFLGRALQTVTPATNSITAAMVGNDLISGKDALTSAPDSTDELLISDGGVLKRIDFSLISGTNTPAFSVKKSSNQTIAATTSTKMELDSEIFDTDNKYDSSTNFRFLPGVAGKYFLSLASSFQNFSSDEIMSVTINKNGSSLSTFNNISGSYSDDFTAATSVIDEANTTDYYEAFIFHRAGSSQTMVGSVSIFSGYKIIE